MRRYGNDCVYVCKLPRTLGATCVRITRHNLAIHNFTSFFWYFSPNCVKSSLDTLSGFCCKWKCNFLRILCAIFREILWYVFLEIKGKLDLVNHLYRRRGKFTQKYPFLIDCISKLSPGTHYFHFKNWKSIDGTYLSPNFRQILW